MLYGQTVLASRCGEIQKFCVCVCPVSCVEVSEKGGGGKELGRGETDITQEKCIVMVECAVTVKVEHLPSFGGSVCVCVRWPLKRPSREHLSWPKSHVLP